MREALSLASAAFLSWTTSGLDLFHGRFDRRPSRWNRGASSSHFDEQLERLENRYCRDPALLTMLPIFSWRDAPREDR